jgi:formylglycine-generating enzyme required for sulfatase activity
MAGTIYEWCRNAFGDPDNRNFPTSAQDLRVLRGGSWYLNQVSARAADRNWNLPFNRFNAVGFRVVCLSPSSGH